MLTRRRFLAGASGTLLVAAFARGNPSGVLGSQTPGDATGAGRAQQNGGPFSVVAPAVGSDGYYPGVSVSMLNPYQGGALLVTATNALAGVARVFGRSYVLTPGPEGIAGFVG